MGSEGKVIIIPDVLFSPPRQEPEDNLDIDKLIDAVRDRECLWDFKDSQYKNMTIRPRLWKEIALEINFDPDKHGEVRKKWQMIKAAYLRSKNQSSREYKYARSLTFLDYAYARRPKISTLNEDSSECSSSFDKGSTRKKIKLTTYRDESIILKRRAVNIREGRSHTGSVKSPEQIFGDWVASELNQFPESQKNEAKYQITNVIYEIKKKLCE